MVNYTQLGRSMTKKKTEKVSSEFKELKEYVETSKDLVILHDDIIKQMKEKIQILESKLKTALTRLGIG
jgi:hypothetical protein